MTKPTEEEVLRLAEAKGFTVAQARRELTGGATGDWKLAVLALVVVLVCGVLLWLTLSPSEPEVVEAGAPPLLTLEEQLDIAEDAMWDAKEAANESDWGFWYFWGLAFVLLASIGVFAESKVKGSLIVLTSPLTAVLAGVIFQLIFASDDLQIAADEATANYESIKEKVETERREFASHGTPLPPELKAERDAKVAKEREALAEQRRKAAAAWAEKDRQRRQEEAARVARQHEKQLNAFAYQINRKFCVLAPGQCDINYIHGLLQACMTKETAISLEHRPRFCGNIIDGIIEDKYKL